MRFTIVLPSLLGNYPGAAKNRDGKLLRAINSVVGQTFDDWELLVIADGCQGTMDIIQNNVGDERVTAILIPRAKLWSGEPRNKGIAEAQGDYIVYLDNDDLFGPNHLQVISDGLKDHDWVWFNDIRYDPHVKGWYENPCEITKLGRHGTSNICHKTNLRVKWDRPGYAHDFYFVQQLRAFKNFVKIQGAEYYVAHIPGHGGYDI